MRGKHGGHAWVRANLGANRHVTHDQRTNTSTTVNLPTPLVLQPVNNLPQRIAFLIPLGPPYIVASLPSVLRAHPQGTPQ